MSVGDRRRPGQDSGKQGSGEAPLSAWVWGPQHRRGQGRGAETVLLQRARPARASERQRRGSRATACRQGSRAQGHGGQGRFAALAEVEADGHRPDGVNSSLWRPGVEQTRHVFP